LFNTYVRVCVCVCVCVCVFVCVCVCKYKYSDPETEGRLMYPPPHMTHVSSSSCTATLRRRAASVGSTKPPLINVFSTLRRMAASVGVYVNM